MSTWDFFPFGVHTAEAVRGGVGGGALQVAMLKHGEVY